MFEGFIGVLIGGAIMYYIQPPVKDFVTKVFAGAPAIMAKAEALKQRAEDLIAKAQEKKQAAVDIDRNIPGA